jgi:hypothetical protein
MQYQLVQKALSDRLVDDIAYMICSIYTRIVFESLSTMYAHNTIRNKYCDVYGISIICCDDQHHTEFIINGDIVPVYNWFDNIDYVCDWCCCSLRYSCMRHIYILINDGEEGDNIEKIYYHLSCFIMQYGHIDNFCINATIPSKTILPKTHSTPDYAL